MERRAFLQLLAVALAVPSVVLAGEPEPLSIREQARLDLSDWWAQNKDAAVFTEEFHDYEEWFAMSVRYKDKRYAVRTRLNDPGVVTDVERERCQNKLLEAIDVKHRVHRV